MGEGMIELSRRADGALAQGFGGDTMNSAVYLARLGVAVDYLTALGDDMESDGMIAALQAERVGTARVLRIPGRLPGLYLIEIDATGERRFLYWRDAAPARELFTLPQSAGLLEGLGEYDILYLSGISLAIWGEPGRTMLFEALDRLRPRGLKVAFDSNWRPRLWPDRDTARQAYGAILRRTDIALAGEQDLCDLFGDPDAAAVLARLRDGKIAEICLRLADPGCLVVAGGETIPVAAEPVEHVLDTTAAGDSFSAGYLAGRLAHRTPLDAARLAHRLAAIVIGHRGAIVPQAATAELAKEIGGP